MYCAMEKKTGGTGNNFYSIRSCTLSQCSDLRIWSVLADLGAATTARARVSGYVEGDLTAFEDEDIVH